MSPYFREMPHHRKKDVESMLLRLQAKGTIEDLKFLRYLHDDELDRLLPAWVADDVRNG